MSVILFLFDVRDKHCFRLPLSILKQLKICKGCFLIVGLIPVGGLNPEPEIVKVTEETDGQVCYEMESPKTCYEKDSQGYEVFYYTSESVPR